MTKFTNLHQHSMYSLLDSIAKVDDMIKKAKELDYEALCISDHGVIYNAPETYISCKENDIGYIYACELYICDDRFEKDNNNRYYHLLVMAYNEEGRINLNKIITDAYKNGFYYKPRTDFQFLSERIFRLKGFDSQYNSRNNHSQKNLFRELLLLPLRI